jgi:hypothetical protein
MRRIMMLATCLAVAVSTAAEAAGPRACQRADETNPNTFLPDNDPDIIVRKVDIESKVSSDIYQIKTYSEAKPSGNTQSEWCFRYEAENIDSKKILKFRWSVAGMWIDPFTPGLRRSLVRQRKLIDDPIKADSRVNAFANDEGLTQSWGVVRVAGKVEKDTGSGPVLAQFAAAEIDPSLPTFLQNNGLVNVPLPAFTFTRDTQRTPETIDAYAAPGLAVEVRSFAELSGNKLTFNTHVSAGGSALEGSLFSMPALESLNATKPQAELLKTYLAFLQQYRELRSQVAKGQREWQYHLELDLGTSAVNARAFTITAPIMVKHGETRECILVSSFAPIGANFPLQECEMLGTR